MKKYLLFAAAAVAVLAGCSKKNITPAPVVPDESSREAVRFNIDAPLAVQTKGVGALDEWESNSEVYVFGYERNTTTWSSQGLLQDIPINPNNASTSPVYPDGNEYSGEPYFYVNDNVYDFYGYYVDDAASGDVVMEDGKGVSIPITIDGTQDIMVAKADPAYDVAGTNVHSSQAYSAYAARREVHPTLKFQHLLSRFRFYVVAGSPTGNNVEVQNIVLKVSNNQATLNIAPNQKLTNLSASVDDITATDFKLYDSDAQITPADNIGTSVDEIVEKGYGLQENSIMVFPGETSHEISINFKLIKTLGSNDAENVYYTQTFEPIKTTLKAESVVTPDGETLTKFEEGYQYDIILRIYGPEEVKITAVLSSWKEGGNIDYDPDKNEENKYEFKFAANDPIKALTDGGKYSDVLPDSYTTQYPNAPQDNDPNGLPWIVLQFDPIKGPITVKATNLDTDHTIDLTKDGGMGTADKTYSVLTLSAAELGLQVKDQTVDARKAAMKGEWLIEVNGFSQKVTIE